MMTNETKIEWKPVPGFPAYVVSELGVIVSRHRRTGRVLREIVSGDDPHPYVFLYAGDGARGRKTRVHVVVLLAFDRPRRPHEQCRHLDGNPRNNRRSNLAWGTALENCDDKQRHGTQPRGETSGTAKLTEADVVEIRRLHGSMSLRALARRFGVSHTAVRRAALGVKWAHLTEAA